MALLSTLESIATASGRISYRSNRLADSAQARTSRAPDMVLLHGIASGSGSWTAQLAASNASIVAWEAPGYGESTPLQQPSPAAADYASSLWQWLDALHTTHPISLVGHSWGALIAAKAAVLHPEKIKRLVLLSPALGYARHPQAERDQVVQQRNATLQTLGPAGMAAKRASALLSDAATPAHVEQVRQVMALLHREGYAQAVQLLVNGDLLGDIATVRQMGLKILIACGSKDTVTPPEKCAQAANTAGVTLIDLGPVGHSCAVEAPEAVMRLLSLTREGGAA